MKIHEVIIIFIIVLLILSIKVFVFYNIDKSLPHINEIHQLDF